MHRPHRSIPIAVGLALLAAAGCREESAADRRSSHAVADTGDIVVAAAWPWAAGEGEDVLYRQGLELAVREVNDAGGIRGRRLRIRFEDDDQSVNQGLQIAQRLASDSEVVGVIGHLQSYVTIPASSIYEGGGMVMISPFSTDPALTARGFERVFRLIFTDKETGAQMAEHAAEQGLRHVAIYYVRSEYGRGLANAFEEHASSIGVSVIARASYESATEFDPRSFEPTLRQWKQLEIDAIFLAAEIPIAAHLIAELRRRGFEQPILGGDAMSFPALIAVGGVATEGTVVAAAFHSAEARPEVVRFTRAFRAQYRLEPDQGAALGYDAVNAFAQALRRAPTPTPDAVAAALRTMAPWEGVTGTIRFDSRGDLVGRNVVKVVVRDGRFEPVAPRVASR